MIRELNLQFPERDTVIVSFDGETTAALPFVNPLAAKDRQDIQWYLEVYGAHSLGDPDDKDAARIARQLPLWGKALFDSVFGERAAARLFNRFQDCEDDARLLTISAEHPTILALAWELLHDPAPGGVFLFNETPRISIRRRVPGATGGRPPFKPKAKERLHLLFVVSRPSDAGFIEPRADAQAVLDALDEHALGRFTWEFLRPATIDKLAERLEDKQKPPVDILHFDGHGVFDRHGGLPERAAEHKGLLHQLLTDALLKQPEGKAPPESPPNTGYLLFEKAEGEMDFVSAQQLGQNLHRHRVALIILSACQTAALGDNDEPMGSVAARLTAAGIPAVIAMTHSVLVATTRALFGEFYKDIARGCGIGEALDNARRYLADHPEKYEVQRGPHREWLHLYDWFLPALYQSGADLPVLKELKAAKRVEVAPPRTNLRPCPEAGFFGRRRELWDIERWFIGPTRRTTITGFGGQGKTALAEEAGRWLTRTGMFEAAAFVDYSRVQSRDAVAVAVNEIGSVLGRTLTDSEAATAALKDMPTLVILDNLEALAAEPLCELLDAAVNWSEAGDSRVLCTTRKPEFGHSAYRIAGTIVHRRIVLEGLGHRGAPDDALGWFAELRKLPPPPTARSPKREALIDVFDRVKFHPLSIRVLAAQLKTRNPEDLGRRLEELLSAGSADGSSAALLSGDTPAGLLASLRLSLDRLDEAARQMLPRLGVFQGGACEDDLLAITEIGEQIWPGLRRQLEDAALIEAETLPGVKVPFMRFHATLAPMLWAQLTPDEQTHLSAAHRERYHAVANFLYQADRQTPQPARAIAWRELPNLLHAVYGALDAGSPDAVGFADRVNRFLTTFGLTRESESLIAKEQAAAGEVGSRAWRLARSNRGEQLRAEGRFAEATEIFEALLGELGDGPSFERAITLIDLGRCFEFGGRPDLAAGHYRNAIAVTEQLEQTDTVKRHRGMCLTDLADALTDQGKYAEARKAYEDGLEIAREVHDLRQQGVSLGQLGTLAMLEGNLEEAAGRYGAALAFFQQLQEPAMEAVGWHQLGRVFLEGRQWDEAERHYRESARIEEQRGNLAGAAQTWIALAVVTVVAGKAEAAEMWYRKAIEASRTLNDERGLSEALSNFANLLLDLPGRLAEARTLAGEALTIKQTLDPGAVGIWTTYNILADIAEKEAEASSDQSLRTELQAQAREYRRLAREAKRNFAGTRQEIRQHAQLIVAVVAATQQPGIRKDLEPLLANREEEGWTNLVAAIRRLIAGERSSEILCEGLDLQDSMIIEAVLEGLSDPSSLKDLLADHEPG